MVRVVVDGFPDDEAARQFTQLLPDIAQTLGATGLSWALVGERPPVASVPPPPPVFDAPRKEPLVPGEETKASAEMLNPDEAWDFVTRVAEASTETWGHGHMFTFQAGVYVRRLGEQKNEVRDSERNLLEIFSYIRRAREVNRGYFPLSSKMEFLARQKAGDSDPKAAPHQTYEADLAFCSEITDKAAGEKIFELVRIAPTNESKGAYLIIVSLNGDNLYYKDCADTRPGATLGVQLTVDKETAVAFAHEVRKQPQLARMLMYSVGAQYLQHYGQRDVDGLVELKLPASHYGSDKLTLRLDPDPRNAYTFPGRLWNKGHNPTEGLVIMSTQVPGISDPTLARRFTVGPEWQLL